jgi:hypothetical protein
VEIDAKVFSPFLGREHDLQFLIPLPWIRVDRWSSAVMGLPQSWINAGRDRIVNDKP